jgi:large subunit ribosomal protein L25
MKTIEITGVARPNLGKTNSKNVRKAGNVPCVLYGDSEPAHFQVDHIQIKKMFYSPETFLVNLNVDGSTSRAVVREAQWHPVHDLLLHVDFLRVTDEKPVVVELPVALSGTAPGVLAGGKLALLSRKLKVSGLVSVLPSAIPVTIAGLGLGESLRVKDMNMEGITFLNPANQGVVGVTVPRAAKEEATTTKAAAPAAKKAAAPKK